MPIERKSSISLLRMNGDSFWPPAANLHLRAVIRFYRIKGADEQQLRQPEPVDVGAVRERAAGELQVRQPGQAGDKVL